MIDALVSLVLGFFVSKLFVFLYCAFIAFWFFRNLRASRAETARIAEGLSRGRRSVEQGLAPGAAGRAEGFAWGYWTIAAELSANPLLKEKWGEYAATLDAGQGAVTGSLPAEEFFSEESLVAPNYRERLYAAIPNYLTGIGILGTFLGLAAGIFLMNRQGGVKDC
jgi:hypothetical protein